MDQKEIEINGQRIAYYESRGKGQPILFVHGNSISGLSFERQFKSSLGKGYRLVALDLPGHGRSAPAKEPKFTCTLPAYADIVHEFVQSLDLGNAVLVGWSLGGHILLEVSGRLLDSAGLMIFGAPPVGKPIAAEAFIPHPLQPLFKNAMKHEEVVALAAACVMPGNQIPAFFNEEIRKTDGKAREALGISIGDGNYSDEVKIVANLNKPLAVVHGEMDPFVNLSYIKGLNIPTLWRGEIQIISGAGHTPHWEQPERFNHLLTEFVGECRKGVI